MKITEAIKKARTKYPHVKHGVGRVLYKDHDGKPLMCAIGFALAGKLGLEKVQQIKTTHDNEAVFYDRFEEIFHTVPEVVYKINDLIGEDSLDSTITALELKGL